MSESIFEVGKTYHICGKLRFVGTNKGWYVIDRYGRPFEGPFKVCPHCKEDMPEPPKCEVKP